MLPTFSRLTLVVVLLPFVQIAFSHPPSFEQEYSEPDSTTASATTNTGNVKSLYSIEGKIFPSNEDHLDDESWFTSTRIIVNYGQYLGFLRKDGSFEINGLSPGSYLVEVTNPDFFYKPVRVDINSKGKIRARKVNYIQGSVVQQVPYPLRFKPKTAYKYFQIRETWRITDFLLNPMVLMMVIPLLLIMILPKMMSMVENQEKEELQRIISRFTQFSLPELSEMVTNFFGPIKQFQDEDNEVKSPEKHKFLDSSSSSVRPTAKLTKERRLLDK